MKSYIINVHGMKSALANMGNNALSNEALKLETAAREEKIEILSSDTAAFMDSLRAYVDELAPLKETSAGGNVIEDKPFLIKMLLVIKTACEEYDENTAENALEELKNMSWLQQTREVLDKIAENLLHSDFDEAVNTIKGFEKTLNK